MKQFIQINPFYRGLLLGFLLKENVKKTFKFLVFNGLNLAHRLNSVFLKNELIKKDQISKIEFIVKITDEDLFREIFHNKLQPGWKYFNNKKVLKIEISDDIIDYLNKNTIDYSNLFELKDSDNEHLISLNIPLFEKFGNVFLYFTYYIDSQKFINVYSDLTTISKNDFILIKPNNFNNILCTSIKYNNKIEYISNYFKLFYNNNTILTSELILMNYDKLNIDIENSKLIIIKDKSIKEYSYTDEIIN